MPTTLLLDRSRWDLVVDAAGNIALAAEPYAIAQDAASAIRLFKGEAYYATQRGVPYFQQILGQAPSLAILKGAFAAAALSVPEVTMARAFVTGTAGREITGQVQLTTKTGQVFGLNETLFGRTAAGAYIPALAPDRGPLNAPASATLSVISAPGDPAIVLELVWSAVTDRDVASYHVELSADGGATWTIDASALVPGTSFVYSGATPTTVYQGRISAVNAVGTRFSPWTFSNQVFSGSSLLPLLNPEALPILDPDSLEVLVLQ